MHAGQRHYGSKERYTNNRPRLSLAILLVCLLEAGSTWAAKTEKDAPVHIEANSVKYDEKKQESLFTGQVVLTQGGLLVEAEWLEIKQDKNGKQKAIAKGQAGKPVRFSQARSDTDERIQGQAQEIDFDSANEVLLLKGKSEIQRLKAGALQDEIRGATLRYDAKNSRFTAQASTVDGQHKSGESNHRVRVTLQPAKQNPDESKPAKD